MAFVKKTQSHTRLYAQSKFERSNKQQRQPQRAQISIVCSKTQIPDSMAHLVLCLVYFIWIVFIRTILHVFVLRYVCVFFFLCYFYSVFAFFPVCLEALCHLMLFHAQQCADMYNMIRQARCTYKSEKFLVKIYLLTTCIYLSQIRLCVSFIVYHTHYTYLVISFHFVRLSFGFTTISLPACSPALYLSPSRSLLKLYSFGFLRSTASWEPHRLHLFPIVTQELRLLSLCVYNSDTQMHTCRRYRNELLKMELSAFWRIPFIEMLNRVCITRFYDIWSIHTRNMYHPVCLSICSSILPPFNRISISSHFVLKNLFIFSLLVFVFQWN